jgi:hypothetical protein
MPRIDTLPGSIALAALALAASQSLGQVDPSPTTPAGYFVYLGASDSTINAARAQGFRIIDIDRVGTNQYDAVLVRNTGEYANSGEAWYPSITESTLTSLLTGKRIIDLQPYDNGGSTLFTAVVVSNAGDDAVPGWGWLYNQASTSALDTWMTGNALRPINIQRATIGGATRWSAVAISNTGSGAAGHWYLYGATTAQISSTIQQLGGFLTDVEVNTQGTLLQAPTFNVTGVIKPIRGWWWYTALEASQIIPTAEALGARPIDIERYTNQSGQTRYLAVYVDNTNEIESRLRSEMGPFTDGDYGFCVKEVGGPIVAQLNANFPVEPASTMKIAQGIRVAQLAQQGQFGAVGLGAAVYNNDTDHPNECPNGVDSSPVTEQIRDVMRRMFSDSDNNATKEISDLCGGYPAISTWLGTITTGAISQIEINHELGCLCQNSPVVFNVAPPRAICDLYEAAHDGTLLNSSFRTQLWDVVSGSNTDGSAVFDGVIYFAAQGLNLTAAERAQFRSLLWYRLKPGGYECDGWYGAQAGIVSIPYKNAAGTVFERTFTGMSFVHDATTESAISSAYSVWPSLFKEQIRDALVTWADACIDLAITDQPDPVTVNAGQAATFSLTVTGQGPITYKWSFNGSTLQDGPNISGATTANLQILSAGAANAGNYICTITNACGATISNLAQLTVNPSCSGDLDANGAVNGADLGALLGAWGTVTQGTANADLNADGNVNGADLGILLGAWGPCGS